MRAAVLLAALLSRAASLKPTPGSATRRHLLTSGTAAAAGVALLPQAASAKGRATQPANYLRYSPRIASFGVYLESGVESTIVKGDWAKLAADCSSVVDKKKQIRIGPIFDGETAMDLWANTYSETKVSDKTKAMTDQVELIAEAREALAGIACKGAGTCLKMEGGFFGFGAKEAPKPSNSQLINEAAPQVVKAKAAYNKFVALNNQNLPMDINPLKPIQ